MVMAWTYLYNHTPEDPSGPLLDKPSLLKKKKKNFL